MTTITIRAQVTENHLDATRRTVDHICEAWAENTAHIQEAHHRREAPLGMEFYTDREGHEHPGWLRESVDALPLPGPSPSWYVQVHAFYGVYVNNGTRYQAPNPFWDRALLRTEGEAEPLLERLTASAMARVRAR